MGKRKRKLSPLNFTKQVFIRPQKNSTKASQLFDSDLEEEEEEDKDDDTDDRLVRGLSYKPLFWEESDLQQHQHGEPLLVEALGDYARMHKQLQLILSNLRRGAVRIA